jgi:hypothetical protein
VIHLQRLLARVLLVVVLVLSANALWVHHIGAWNPGMANPVLGYDAAQYAIAARHLAETGDLATTFALPIELAKHPSPPWPLAVLQPGLVLAEAWIFKVTPKIVRIPGAEPMLFNDPTHREQLMLVIPFICFLAIAAAIGLATSHLILARKPDASIWLTSLAGFAVAAPFLLDPEAQHFASGGFTELPFTLGLTGALAAIALGRAARFPLIFGLLMGATGLFRGNMLWIAPGLAVGAAIAADPGRRRRVFVLAMIGWAIPLIPWWYYKWQAFGSPAWDLSSLSLWDGVQGRSWFTLNHLPAVPELPTGVAAFSLIVQKILGNLPRVLLAVFTGPRALWVGALVLWLIVTKKRDAAWGAGLAILGAALTNLLIASATIPWLRYMFPVRVLIEVAGLLAMWDLAGRMGTAASGRSIVRLTRVGVAAIALAYGVLQTQRGVEEAATSSAERGTPRSRTLDELAELIQAEVPANEPVMSNLGPVLSWRARRHVIHLAQTPDDINACRERVEFRHVILVFRDAERAWRGWDRILEQPAEAPQNPDWNVKFVRQFRSEDGFNVVWLELGPTKPGLALR